jgi:hypothetical protein
MFHTLQFEVGWLRDSSGWLLEGSAEYVGFGAVVAGGTATWDVVKTCKLYFDGNDSSIPSLDQVFPLLYDGRYGVAWIAVDRLVNGLIGIPVLRRYWESSGDWTARFTNAFGVGPDDFYRDFAQYRRTLTKRGSYPCAGF